MTNSKIFLGTNKIFQMNRVGEMLMLKKLLFVIFSLFLMACTQEETFKSYDHAIQSVMEEHNIEPNQLILNIEELDKIIIFYYTGFDVICFLPGRIIPDTNRME